jgi:hypothetical protein
MAATMTRFLEHPLPAENVFEAGKHMSWENYARAIRKD